MALLMLSKKKSRAMNVRQNKNEMIPIAVPKSQAEESLLK